MNTNSYCQPKNTSLIYSDFLMITGHSFVEKMNQILIHVLTVLHFSKSFINQLLTNDCLLKAYLIWPVVALGLRPVSVLPLSCPCFSFQIPPDGLAPPISLRDWCHLFRAFLIQVSPRWCALSPPPGGLMPYWALYIVGVVIRFG